MAFFVSTMVTIFQHADDINNNPEYFPFADMAGFIVLIIITSLINLAALILFIIHAINNKSLPDTERIIWVLVFVFAGMIGFPIYWFMKGIKYDPSVYKHPVS